MVLVDLVKSVAERKGTTPAQIALAWLLAQKPWIVPIPGTTKLLPARKRTLVQRRFKLNEADLKQIDEASSNMKLEGARLPEGVLKMGTGSDRIFFSPMQTGVNRSRKVKDYEMKSKLIVLGLCVLILNVQSAVAQAAPAGAAAAPTVRTHYGAVRGVTKKGMYRASKRFPFAPAPVSDNRWRPPQPLSCVAGREGCQQIRC